MSKETIQALVAITHEKYHDDPGFLFYLVQKRMHGALLYLLAQPKISDTLLYFQFHGQPILHYVLQNGDVRAVRVLLQSPYRASFLRCTNQYGASPLTYLYYLPRTRTHYNTMLNLLLDAGAQTNYAEVAFHWVRCQIRRCIGKTTQHTCETGNTK